MSELTRLLTIQDIVMNAKALQPREVDGETVTYCNEATRRICVEFGYNKFPVDKNGWSSKMMNAMIDQIESDRAWVKEPMDAGVRYAFAGGLALLVKKYSVHGHGASICPEPMGLSGSLSAAAGQAVQVPVVANVGRTNGRMLATAAFTCVRKDPTTGKKVVIPEWAPECYLLVG